MLYRVSSVIALLAAALSLVAAPAALADAGSIPVTLQGHKFFPAEIHVKANQPTTIALTNKDDTAEEFDSTALKVEKVVAAHGQGEVRLRPLAPGTYTFMGEFHPDTAQGVVIAE